MPNEKRLNPVVCSFCHRKQEDNPSLGFVSAPSDYPNAWICSVCIHASVEMVTKPPRSVDDATLRISQVVGQLIGHLTIHGDLPVKCWDNIRAFPLTDVLLVNRGSIGRELVKCVYLSSFEQRMHNSELLAKIRESKE